MNERVLTDEHRRRVEENLGLVGWHIRRHVPGIDQPRREREWDDLFQEGCLGLVQAVSTYDPQSGVPFPTFALRRIQRAVSRALHRAFATVRLPEEEAPRAGGVGSAGQKVVSLEGEPLTRRACDRHHPHDRGDRETIGDCIRERYDRAVRQAVTATKASRSRRDDRHNLIERLAADRLVIPNDEQRVPLRQIARETKSSYARVVYTEKRLIEHIRSLLEQDVELSALREEARRRREGVDSEMDATATRRLSAAAGSRFGGLFDGGSPERRGAVLLGLMERCGLDAGELARSLFGRLNPDEKTRLVARCTAEEAH